MTDSGYGGPPSYGPGDGPGYGQPGHGPGPGQPSGYGQPPGYGAPAFGPPGYGAGYGAPGYGAPGYGAPAYGPPGYGAPAPWWGPPPGPQRPGTVLAASVLLFVQAGLVLIASFYASLIGSIATAVDGNGGSGLVIATTIVQLLSVGLLIAGGAVELSGRPQLLWAAVASQLLLALYWVFRIQDLAGPGGLDGFGVVPVFFVVAPVVALGLSFATSARQWGQLQDRRRAEEKGAGQA